jgi:hypothetical protein
MSTATVGRGEGYRSRCILPHITVGARSRGCSSSLPHAGGRCTASSGMAVEKRRRRPAHLPGGHRLPRKEQEAQAAVRRWEAASELGETGHRRKARERSSRRGGVRLQHCRSFVSSLRGSRGKRRGGGQRMKRSRGTTGRLVLQVMQQGERRAKKPRNAARLQPSLILQNRMQQPLEEHNMLFFKLLMQCWMR